MTIRWFIQRPTLRQLPLAVLKVALAGAVLGVPCSLFIGWLTNAPWARVFAHPWWWVGSSAVIGAFFGTTFYLTCAVPIEYLKRWTQGFRRGVARALVVLTATAGGSLGCVIAIKGLEILFHAHLTTPLPLGKMALVDGLIAAVISLVIGAFTKLNADKQLRERSLSEAAAKAQTFALQAQINPHFFFNTLNTISALIPIDPAAAQETIGRLADMFRYTLACSTTELASLDDELAFARNYLLLERARFGERLQVELPESGGLQGVLLPGLTLQPIVENAVRYGVARRIEGGAVRVEIERGDATCDVRVLNQFDPGDGPPNLNPSAIFRNGHALANIRERLSLLFGDRATLCLSVNGDEWVRVTVQVPVGAAGR